MFFDVSHPPFDDPRVRRAFVLAADRQAIADLIGGGEFSPGTGGLVPPGMPGHSPGIGLPYDPEGARQLLAEAGYPGGQGFPDLVAWTIVSRHWFAFEHLQAQWRETLGVEVALVSVDDDVLWNRQIANLPPVWFLVEVAPFPDPYDFLGRGEGLRHQTRWRNEAFDKLVGQARRSPDQGERMRLYGQAERILVQEAAIVPLFYPRWCFLLKPWVKLPALPFRHWYWKEIIIEPH